MTRPRNKTLLFAMLGALGAGVGALFACGGSFDPASKVDSVRIFGVRADKPFVTPGETVTLEALFTDARRDKPRPLKNYWIPVVCLNPREDLYYACFIPSTDGGASGTRFIPGGPLADAGVPEAGTAADAGAAQGGNLLDRIPRGIDLGPFLPQGSTFSFTMPVDAIQPRERSRPYALAYVFNLACAGQVRLSQPDPSAGPQAQVPLQCTDEEGTPLPPSDYVIGISRVYSYPDRTNTNPVIDKITLDGVDVDPQAGITVERCVADRRANCKEYKIDIKVPESSWEPNPTESGEPLREQIWATYYTDVGEFQDEARLLYDTTKGRVNESDNTYRAPYDPAEGTLWAVVHDNRAGAAFVVIPIHVK